MIKVLIFDFYGVLHNFNTGKIDLDLLKFANKLSRKYRLALLSNVSNKSFSEAAKTTPQITNIFELIATSESIGFAKPNLQAFLYVSSELGVLPSECVMIDDNVYNTNGAEQAGMQAILYKGMDDLCYELRKLKSNQ